MKLILMLIILIISLVIATNTQALNQTKSELTQESRVYCSISAKEITIALFALAALQIIIIALLILRR